MNERPSGIIHLPHGITSEEALSFAKAFADTMAKNPPMTILADSYPSLDLIGHDGHCGPRRRPLRRDALTGWRFKTCRHCHRRYVWDQGQWVQLLSELAVQRLERELGIEPLDHS